MKWLTFFFLCSPLVLIGQTYFFENPKAFDAFLTNLSISTEEFVKKYNGKEVSGTSWCAESDYYFITYRIELKKYYFSVAAPAQASLLTRLEALLDSPEFTKVKEKASYYDLKVENGKCIPTDIIASDGRSIESELKKHFDKPAKLQGILDKIGIELPKIPDPPSGEKEASEAFSKLQGYEGEIGDMIEQYFEGTEAQGQFEGLKGEYTQRLNEINKELGDEDSEVNQPNQKTPNEQLGKGNNPKPSDNPNGDNVGGKKNGSNGSGGMPGPFKIKTPFSKWFVTLMDMVATYLGIKDISLQVLTVAYALCPEVFDYLGSYLAKAQKALTSNSFDEFLNGVADLYQHAMKFLKYAELARDLLQEGAIRELAGKIDWKKVDIEKAVNWGAEKGLIPKDQYEKLKRYIPMGILNGAVIIDPEKIRKGLTDFALDKAQSQIGKLGKYGQMFDFKGLYHCAKNNSCEDWVKKQSASYVVGSIPGWSNYQNTIERALNGDIKGAGEELVTNQVAQKLGISKNDALQILKDIQNGDLEGFAKSVSKTQIKRLPSRCQPLAQKAINGWKLAERDAFELSKCILQSSGNEGLAEKLDTWGESALWDKAKREEIERIIRGWNVQKGEQMKNTIKEELKKSGVTEVHFNSILKGNSAPFLKDLIKEAGIVNGSAQNYFLKGDVRGAFEQQLQSGSNWSNTYKFEASVSSMLHKVATRHTLLKRFVINGYAIKMSQGSLEKRLYLKYLGE